jgi:hypothetical protein
MPSAAPPPPGGGPPTLPPPPEAPPGRRYKVDAVTADLAAGAAGPVWGLNVSAHALEPEPLRAPYAALASALTAALAPAAGYVYPFAHLHVTAASPAPFTHATLDASDAAEYEAAFLAALAEEAVPGRGGFPDAPFPLIYGRPRLDAAAGIFVVDDPTGAMPRVRAAIARAAARPEVAKFAARAAMRTPGIVHCSFVRFGAPPAEGFSDDDIAAAFDAAAAAWEPVTIVARELLLVREVRPYLHLDLGPGGADEACIIGRFPYGPAGGGGDGAGRGAAAPA